MREGRPNPKNRSEEIPITTLLAEVESWVLAPEKQQAFGYVLGVMFGDGSISKVRDKVKYLCRSGNITYHPRVSYRPRLQVTSREFAEDFVRQWEMLTGRRVSIAESLRTNFKSSTLKSRKPDYQVQLFVVAPRHAQLGRYLAHLKYEKEPEYLMKFPREVFQGFTDGMIDSEGYVCDSYTDIANKDRALLHVLVKMFRELGRSAKVYDSPSQNVAHLRLKPA